MFKEIKEKLDYLRPWKTIPSFIRAFERAKKEKDKSFLEKVSLFFDYFDEEMKNLDKDKKETAEKTDKAVKQSVEGTVKDAKDTFKLPYDVTNEEKDLYEEALGMSVVGFKSLDNDHQRYAYTGFAKAEKVKDGKGTDNLTVDEAASLSAVALMTLRGFKRRYNDKSQFKAALDKVYATLDKVYVNPDKSSYNFKKLLNFGFWKGLKPIMIGLSTDIPGNIAAGNRLAKGLGMKNPSEAFKLGGLKEKPLKNKPEIVKIFKDYFVPNTSDENIGKLVDIVNGLIANRASDLNTDTITELVFTVDERDLDRLISVLSGKVYEGQKA